MPVKIVIQDKVFSKEDLIGLCREFIQNINKHSRLIIHGADRLAFCAGICLGEFSGCGIIVAPSHWEQSHIETEASQWGANRFLHSGRQPGSLTLSNIATPSTPRFESGIILFTSGTTGNPKAIRHSWESISASSNFVGKRLVDRTWLLTYEPAAYAGLQVFFSAVRNKGTLVTTNGGFPNYARAIVQHGVDIISATPTWWRMLIAGWPENLPKPSLHQVTLGGEIVDQTILDLVERHFRPSHLTHIYATSEVGTAIVVSDRKAGFPINLMSAPRRTELRVVNDALEVKSPFQMQGFLDSQVEVSNWIRTGDLLEMRGDRYYFVGREDLRLNIGGAKVTLEEVEIELSRHPDILDCVAYGKSSPIVGTLLAVDIVPAHPQTFNITTFKNDLRTTLPPYKVPQHIRLVNHIGVSPSGKKQRK